MQHAIQKLFDDHAAQWQAQKDAGLEPLGQPGELTFREICAGLNCYSTQEVQEARRHCRHLGRLGEADIMSSTILFPKQTGCKHYHSVVSVEPV